MPLGLCAEASGYMQYFGCSIVLLSELFLSKGVAMRSIRSEFIFMLFVGILPVVASAEFRPWTDLKNNSIEAEFVRMSGETVVLCKQDGRTLKVPLDSLCEVDREYAMLHSPPKMKIIVTDHEDSEVSSSGGGPRGRGGAVSRVTAITADVELIKSNAECYELELKLDLIFVGKTGSLDRHKIVGRFSSAFTFTADNKGAYADSFGPVDITSGGGPEASSVKYENYLLVVRDRTDQIIAVKAGRADFEKNAAVLVDSKNGAIFDRDFRLISEADASAE
jgi:hypothetical protein